MELGLNENELENIKTLGMDLWNEFPWVVEKEFIFFLLNHFKDESIVLEKPYLVTQEAIKEIIGLCSIGDLLGKKTIKYKDVEELTGISKDPQDLLINTLKDLDVRYVAYDISYKIYFRNREGSTSAIIFYIAHMMVKENKKFDLCSLLLENIYENVRMLVIEGYPFHFGSLLVCLVFYFLCSLLGK